MRVDDDDAATRERLLRALRYDARATHERHFASQITTMLRRYTASLHGCSSDDDTTTAASVTATSVQQQQQQQQQPQQQTQSQSQRRLLECTTRELRAALAHDVDAHTLLALLVQQVCTLLVPLTAADMADTTMTTTTNANTTLTHRLHNDHDDNNRCSTQACMPHRRRVDATRNQSVAARGTTTHGNGAHATEQQQSPVYTLYASVYAKWGTALALLAAYADCIGDNNNKNDKNDKQDKSSNNHDNNSRSRNDDDDDDHDKGCACMTDATDVYAVAWLDVLTCMLAQLQSWSASLPLPRVDTRAPSVASLSAAIATMQRSSRDDNDDDDNKRDSATVTAAAAAAVATTASVPLGNTLAERVTTTHMLHRGGGLALLLHIHWWCAALEHAARDTTRHVTHDAAEEDSSTTTTTTTHTSTVTTMRHVLTAASVRLFRAVLVRHVVRPVADVLGELLVRVLVFAPPSTTQAHHRLQQQQEQHEQEMAAATRNDHNSSNNNNNNYDNAAANVAGDTYAQTLATLDASVTCVCAWCRTHLALPYYTSNDDIDDNNNDHDDSSSCRGDASSTRTLGDVVRDSVAQLAVAQLAEVAATHTHVLLLQQRLPAHDDSQYLCAGDDNNDDDDDARCMTTTTATATTAAKTTTATWWHRTAAHATPHMSQRLRDALDCLQRHVGECALRRDGNYATLRRLCAH